MIENKYDDKEILEKCKNAKEVAELIEDFNKWRRGDGIYKWDEDPAKVVDYGLTPKQLGFVLTAASNMLRGIWETVSLHEYQKKAQSFATYGSNPLYAYFGLIEEVAELIGKLKGNEFNTEQKEGEIGDVMWMLSAIYSENNWDMEEIRRQECTMLCGMALDELITQMELSCGEIAGKIAKFIRKHNGLNPYQSNSETDKTYAYALCVIEFKNSIRSMLERIYITVRAIIDYLGLTERDVLVYNIEKLTERKNKGLIVGDGDTIEERIKNQKGDKSCK